MGELSKELNREVLGIAKPDALPEIELPKTGKLISTFIKEISPYLVNSKMLFYRPDEKAVVRIETRDDKVVGFVVVSPQDFVTVVEKYVRPVRDMKDEITKIWSLKSKSLNCELSKIILASEQLQKALPEIAFLYDIPMPVLKDGFLKFPKIGYDDDLKSWLNPHSPALNPDVNLEDAKQVIFGLVEEFCFESPQDKVNAIASLITPFLRNLYSRNTCRTPIMFWKANRERAGKDYGAGMSGIIYYGESVDDTPIVSDNKIDDVEFRKKILSIFKSGRNRLHSANNKGYLNSAQLENLATTENFTDRALGGNVTLTFPNTLEISLSANTGITYTPDIAKRCLFIKLFLDLEDPNFRVFKNQDLHGWIRDNRSLIISSLYAFVRAWYASGMPSGDSPFASFPDWARVCGGIMKVCGLGDPCIPNAELISIGGDSETDDMKVLFEVAHAVWGEHFILKNKIMDALQLSSSEQQYFDFQDLFGWFDWEKRGSRNSFGLLFEKYVGRVFSDIRLIKHDSLKRGRSTFCFKKVIRQESGTVGTLGTVPYRANIKSNDKFNICDVELSHLPQVSHPRLKEGYLKAPYDILLPCADCGANPPCKYELERGGKPACELCATLSDDEPVSEPLG